MSGDGGRKLGRTRREILADAAKAAAALSVTSVAACFPDVGGEWPQVSPLCLAPAIEPPTGSSKVVEVYREDSVLKTTDANTGSSKNVIQLDVVKAMVDAALSSLAGGVDNPWPVLLPNYQPGKRIGLKVNCLNAYLPTSPAVVRAIIASLRDRLGVDPTTIVVWDRRLDELTGAGKYSADDLAGAQLRGTVNSTTDSSGPGYGEAICGKVAGKSPRLSRILTDQTDITINCPVLKTHVVSGITGAMKNIYGIIDNPGDYHDNLNTALPALYALPPIRNSINLTIVDALIMVATQGTEARPDTVGQRILVSRDPVAIDAYSLTLVNKLRADRPKPFAAVDDTLIGWIDGAHQLGVGTKQFDLVQV